jgi:hypothetical protein
MLKFLLFILIIFVVFIILGAFKIFRFFRSFINPAKSVFNNNGAVNNRPEQVTKNEEVLYSKNEVVVLKGEAKDKE